MSSIVDFPGKHRILVADDDPSIRLLVATYLRRQGFQLLEACNGREALEEMRAGHADLVLLDLMMPEVSGLEVLSARAADPSIRQIPVIVLSANGKPKVSADVGDKGVWAVIPKPFDLDVLLTTVAACFEHTDAPSPAVAA